MGFMSDPAALIIIISQGVGLFFTIIGLAVKLERRLTRIETTTDFIKENCPVCQHNLETRTK